MRRLAALLAAVLAVACHSRDDRDTTPPGVPAILAPVEGDVLGTAELVAGEVVLSGTAEAGALVTLEIDGVVAATASASGGAWSVAATLPDGSHTARARACDASGNSSAFSRAVGFAVDTLPPASPAITAPANDTLTSAASLTVTGTAPADAALVRLLDATSVVTTGIPTSGTFAFVLTPAEGAHVYATVAVDAAGNVSPPSSSVTVTVDRTAPATPVVLAPPDGDVLGAAELVADQVVFSGTAGAGALVALEVDGAVAATAIAGPGGAWSVAATLADGSHTARAHASDAAGNSSAATAPITVVVDRAPPSAPAITSPTTGTLTRSASLTVIGTAPADAALVRVLDATSVVATGAPSGGTFTFAVTPAEGAHVYTAVAVDAAGNVSPPSSAVAVMVDRTAPGIPVVLAPAEGAVLDATGLVAGQVVFSGTADAGALVTLELDGAVAATAIAGAGGAWSVAATLLDAAHIARARASDAAGNPSAWCTPVGFTLDSGLPAPPVLSSPAGSLTTNALALTVGGTAEALTSVRLFLDGILVAETPVDANGTFLTSVTLPGSDGSVALTAVAADSSGNASAATPPISVLVDRTAPSAPAIASPADDTLTRAASLTVTGTTTTDAAAVRVLDATFLVTTGAPSGGTFTFSVTPGEGAHVYTAVAVDAAGNVSLPSPPVTVSVDRTPPAIPVVLAPAAGATVNAAQLVAGQVVFSGTADPDALVALEIDGAAAATAVAGPGGAWSVAATLADGSHTARAHASDAAGNSSAATAPIAFDVDRAAPSAPGITSPATDTLTRAVSLTVSGTAPMDAALVSLLDATSVVTTGAPSSGSFTFVVAPGEGAHVYTAVAADAAGNVSPPSPAVTVTVDRTPPAIPAVLAPVEGDVLAAAELVAGQVAFSGTAEAGALVTLEVDGLVAATAIAGAGGDWALAAAVPDGPHTARTRASDAAGNLSAFCTAVGFTVDATLPATPVLTSPAGSLTTNALDLTAGGTAEALASVRLFLDGVLVEETAADTNGTFLAFLTLPGSDGPVALTAVAVDSIGNTSAATTPISILVDRTAPAAPAITSPANDTVTRAASLTVTGTAPPDAATIRLFDAASLVTTGVPSSGSFALVLTPGEGAHVYTAVAVDAAGNVSPPSAAITVTVDRTPPAIPVVLAPAGGTILDAADLLAGQVVFSGTADAGARVTIEVDGAATATALAGPGGAWSVAATLAEGAHTARAGASDAAGNASAFCAAVTFTVDLVRLAQPLAGGSQAPLTSFAQTVADTSGLPEVFPGQANTWALDRDFSLRQGFGFQFDSALVLYAGQPTAPLSHDTLFTDVQPGGLDAFPYDQTATEAAFLTPLFTVADGVVTAAVSDGASMGVPPLAGSQSAYLNGTSGSRLARTLSLTVGETYTVNWTHQAVLRNGNLVGAALPPHGAAYQVVLRDPVTDAVIGAPLFSATGDVPPSAVSVTRAGLPAVVTLSFELRSAAEGYAELDDVTLEDGSGQVALANGDFETGSLAPWIANDGAESQNVRSGQRELGTGASALQVTRTFYAPPAASWGRMVDVFENHGTTPVATRAVYLTSLEGSVPLAAVTHGGTCVVGWDPLRGGRDVGLVSGTGTAYVADGSQFVFVVHDLTVPAGGQVALVHFVVQLGEAAGGPTVADVPTGTDDECGTIAAGFRSVDAYKLDLPPGVLRSASNL